MGIFSQGRTIEAGQSRGLVINGPFGRPGAQGDPGADKAARSLPPELAFLLQEGVAPDTLHDALSAAPRGVLPLEAVLASGVIDEEGYYAALARRLGAPYYRGAPSFAPTLDPGKSLRCGVAPLASGPGEPRAVIAPDGLSTARLIEAVSAGRLSGESFAVVAPRRLAAMLRMRAADAILSDALGRLPDSLSARRGMNRAQVAVVGLAVAAAALVGVADLPALVAAISLALWAFFLATILLRSIAAVADNAAPRIRLLTDDEAPIYTVVAAVYREAAVIENLIQAFEAFDYPALGSKLDLEKPR